MPSDPPDDIQTQLDHLPSIDDAPVAWDARRGAFVPVAERPGRAGGAAAASAPHEESPVGWQRGGAPPASSPASAARAPAPASAVPAPPAPPVGPPARPGRQLPPPKPPRPARSPKPATPGRRARLVKRLAVLALVVVLLLTGGLFAFGYWQFSRIPRVDVASVLSPPSPTGTNYLIVGTDSREGIAASDPNAGAFLGPGDPEGSARTDSILVLRVTPSGSSLLSIPRDLWVKDPKTGQFGRINAVYQSGPAQLIKAVQNLGIPVQHYLEINFVSFAGLVDSVGGIDVTFPLPTRDRNSGLDVPTAGVAHLDGVEGLAYVRSRHYEELKNGKWVEDPLSDLGRVLRQRQFLSALLRQVAGSKNPFTLYRVAGSLGVGLKIDNTLGYLEALGLAWRLRDFNPASDTIPTKPKTVGGAAVLDLAPDAPGVINRYK